MNPVEDLITFETLVAPQRLMSNLGYNRNEREQGLVSQLQNTSLTQARDDRLFCFIKFIKRQLLNLKIP